MKPSIHVWERKSNKELLIRALPGSSRSILFVNFFLLPFFLYILLNLLKVLHLEGTLAIRIPCLEGNVEQNVDSDTNMKREYFIQGSDSLGKSYMTGTPGGSD